MVLSVEAIMRKKGCTKAVAQKIRSAQQAAKREGRSVPGVSQFNGSTGLRKKAKKAKKASSIKKRAATRMPLGYVF